MYCNSDTRKVKTTESTEFTEEEKKARGYCEYRKYEIHRVHRAHREKRKEENNHHKKKNDYLIKVVRGLSLGIFLSRSLYAVRYVVRFRLSVSSVISVVKLFTPINAELKSPPKNLLYSPSVYSVTSVVNLPTLQNSVVVL